MSIAPQFKLRLYVAGEAPNSLQAIDNLRAICRESHLDDRNIEIVDVLRDPMRAMNERVLLTPTLVRLAPLPIRKIIGSLKDRPAVCKDLGLHPPKE